MCSRAAGMATANVLLVWEVMETTNKDTNDCRI